MTDTIADYERTPEPTTARVLVIDIESSPIVAETWGLWGQNISPDRIREPQRTLCWAAKWLDAPEVLFASEFHHDRERMVRGAWDLLNKADAVVTYNGTRYDIPHLNREFILAGLPIPKPAKQIDLLRIVKARFRFESNKLGYVAQRLGLTEQKGGNEGHSLWQRCLAGDAEAWDLMKAYNIQDVRTTAELHLRLRGWQTTGNTLNMALFVDGRVGCPHCPSTDLRGEGTVATTVTLFSAYRCSVCGGVSRSVHRTSNTAQRPVR